MKLKWLPYLLAVISSHLCGFPVFAQAEVEDRRARQPEPVHFFQRSESGSGSSGRQQNIDQSGTSNQEAAASAASNNLAELYYQIQVLQQEVLQLRGLVEEQAHELKKLKKQRLDDYLDLDRRISKMSSGSQSGESDPQFGEGEAAQQDELKSYRSAIDLVLKQQDYEAAITEFSNYLKRFPDGKYAANAQYWLGEIYLLRGNLEQSRQWFSSLLRGFPSHNKVPDAKFKLGKVLHLMENKIEAKRLLEEVANSNANAASLAKEYLNTHFSS